MTESTAPSEQPKTIRYVYVGYRITKAGKMDFAIRLIRPDNSIVYDDGERLLNKAISGAAIGFIYEWDLDADDKLMNRRLIGKHPDTQLVAEWVAQDWAARVQKSQLRDLSKSKTDLDRAVELLKPVYQKLNRFQRAALILMLTDELNRP